MQPPKRSFISPSNFTCRAPSLPFTLSFKLLFTKRCVNARYVIWQTEPQRGLNKDANDANDSQRHSLWGKNRICKHASIRLPLSHRFDYSGTTYFVTTARRLCSKRSDVGFLQRVHGKSEALRELWRKNNQSSRNRFQTFVRTRLATNFTSCRDKRFKSVIFYSLCDLCFDTFFLSLAHTLVARL